MIVGCSHDRNMTAACSPKSTIGIVGLGWISDTAEWPTEKWKVDASPRERELRAVDTGIGSGWKGDVWLVLRHYLLHLPRKCGRIGGLWTCKRKMTSALYAAVIGKAFSARRTQFRRRQTFLMMPLIIAVGNYSLSLICRSSHSPLATCKHRPTRSWRWKILLA